MFQMIPQTFLVKIAKSVGISRNELAVLKYAIGGESMETISSRLGNVKKEALQKRMGEVYRKFEIVGSGPGKLAKLQQKLMMEYQQSLEQSEKLVSIKSHLSEKINESSPIDWQKLSEEETQIIYTLACADQPLTLEQLQTRITLNDDFSELLINMGEMLKRQLLEKTVEDEITKFYLPSNLNKYAIYYLNEKVREIGTFNKLENLKISEILHKLGIAKSSSNPEQIALLCQQFSKNLNRLGHQQYLEGELNSAKFNFILGIKLNPDLASAHYNLGSTYEQLEAIDLAIAHYEKSLSLNQKPSLAALCNLARLDILSGNFAQCIKRIEPVLNQVTDQAIQADLYKNLAWAYFLQNHYSEAEINLQVALKLNANKPFYHCLMAQILEAQGQMEKALIHWKNCLNNLKNHDQKTGILWQTPELKIGILQAQQKVR